MHAFFVCLYVDSTTGVVINIIMCRVITSFMMMVWNSMGLLNTHKHGARRSWTVARPAPPPRTGLQGPGLIWSEGTKDLGIGLPPILIARTVYVDDCYYYFSMIIIGVCQNPERCILFFFLCCCVQLGRRGLGMWGETTRKEPGQRPFPYWYAVQFSLCPSCGGQWLKRLVLVVSCFVLS